MVPIIPELVQCGVQKYSNEPALSKVCVNVEPAALCSELFHEPSDVQFAPDTTS